MSTARLSNLRIAPRKLRVLAKMLRGMPVTMAINSLRFMNKSGSREFFKLLVSAVANAWAVALSQAASAFSRAARAALRAVSAATPTLLAASFHAS